MLDWRMTGARVEGSRPALVIVLLLAALGATAGLFWQAQRAVSSHRRAASNVLSDYAALAADEFVRRAAASIGYDGIYPLVTAMSRVVTRDAVAAEVAAAMAVETGGDRDEAGSLARLYFTTHQGGLTVSPGTRVPPWLASTVAALPEVEPPFAVRHLFDGTTPRMIVLLADAPDGAAGFEVEVDHLRRLMEPLLEEPLLPESLGGDELTNSSLFVSVLDPGGTERFRWGRRPESGFDAARPFGGAYGGVLEGFDVHVSLSPDAADELLIGGLPESRVALLGGLFALTLALLAVAVYQLRREHALQELRSEFVSSASHELRTPLAQIRMSADTLLLERVRSEDERQRALRAISRETARLTQLVENLLRFSRADDRSNPSRADEVELPSLVAETVELFEPLARARSVRIEARPGAGRAAVDASSMKQVLLNLLDNAVKYGPDGQRVVVRVEDAPSGTRLVVEDEGAGVPDSERERIFERFYRLDRDRASAVAGTGIGLSVVREIVARFGGSVFVEDRAPRGTRVVVELPAERTEPGE